MRRAAALLWAVLLAGPCAAAAGGEKPAAEAAYTFTLDGKPLDPDFLSLDGDPAHPQAGDVLFVGDMALTLGPEKRCDFISTPEEDGRLLLKQPDGSQRVVALRVGAKDAGGQRQIDRMSPQEMHGLWGLRLDDRPFGIEEKLGQLDPERVCITVTHEAQQGERPVLAELPKALRNLIVDDHSYERSLDYAPLARLEALRFLYVAILRFETQLDLRHIGGHRGLHRLIITANELRGLDALAMLENLRCLDLVRCEGVSHVTFAKSLRHLRHLDVSGTKVRDLSPLNNLDRLERVFADGAPVERLPGALPSLRLLQVQATRVGDEALAEFTKTHPRCEVRRRLTETLRRAVAAANCIRVYTGVLGRERQDRHRFLFQVIDAKRIADVIAHIEIDEAKVGPRCPCFGDPMIEFYRDDKLLAAVGFKHGKSLRWPGGWPTDGPLTDKSAEYLVQLMIENGVTEPRKEREEHLRHRPRDAPR